LQYVKTNNQNENEFFVLFCLVIFLSATLGVMSVQGRNNHSGSYLSWAWWNGLVGLIMTIITFVALIALVMDMEYSITNKTSGQMTRLLLKDFQMKKSLLFVSDLQNNSVL
jgi:uncharacterized membrane protein